jgi:hypothetical protein
MSELNTAGFVIFLSIDIGCISDLLYLGVQATHARRIGSCIGLWWSRLLMFGEWDFKLRNGSMLSCYIPIRVALFFDLLLLIYFSVSLETVLLLSLVDL